MSRRKLLSLNFFPTFYPAQTGGEQRAYHLLRQLSETFEVQSVTPTFEGVRDELVSLGPHLVEARFTRTEDYRRISAHIRRKDSPIHRTAMTYALAARSHETMVRYISSIWSGLDGVILQHPTCLGLLDHFQDAPKPLFYVSHNCEFELAVNAHRETSSHEFLQIMFQLEERSCAASRGVFATTQEDALKFRHLFGVDPARLYVCGNGSVQRVPEEELASPANARSVLFIGSSWGPNVEAARYIVESIAPTLPNFTFHIVGNVCGQLKSTTCGSNVILHQQIPEGALAELLRDTHIGINPISEGSGSNVKVADYLAHGLQVVTTLKGARGFEAGYENLHMVGLSETAAEIERVGNSLGAPTSAERRAWCRASRAHWAWDEIGGKLAAAVSAGLDHTGGSTAKRNRLLVLNEFPVRGHHSGGEARIAGLLSCPDGGVDVSVVTFGRETFRINPLGDSVACIEIPATVAQLESAKERDRYSYASTFDVTLPETVDKNPVFVTAVEAMASRSDGIILEHPFMWPVLERLQSALPVVFGSHNVEAIMKPETIDTHRQKEEILASVERSERRLTERAEIVLACSDADARQYKSWGARAVAVVENGVSDPVEAEVAPRPRGAAESRNPVSRNQRLFWVEDFTVQRSEDIPGALESFLARAPNPEEVAAARCAYAEGGLHGMLRSLLAKHHSLDQRPFVFGLPSPSGEKPFVALFLGTAHRPNLTATELILKVIAPACPDVAFLIVGRVVESLGPRVVPHNVFLIGFVSDEEKRRILESADLGLNPMTEGGGSNLKIPDYLSHGLPVLSTHFGSRGFEVEENEGLYRADLLGFPEAIARLRSAPPERAGRGKGPASLESYRWRVLSQRYFDRVREAALCRTHEYVLVLEDGSILRSEEYSAHAQTVAALCGLTSMEIVAATDLNAPSSQLPPLRAHNGAACRFFRRDLAERVAVEGLPRHGAFNGLVAPIVEVEPEDVAATRRAHPWSVILGSGWSVPLFNGTTPYRLVSGRAVIHVPTGAREIRVVGYARSSTALDLVAGARVAASLSTPNISKYEIAAELEGETEVTLCSRALSNGATREYYVTVERIFVRGEAVWEEVGVASNGGVAELAFRRPSSEVHQRARFDTVLCPPFRDLPHSMAAYLRAVVSSKRRIIVMGSECFVRDVRNVCLDEGLPGDRVLALGEGRDKEGGRPLPDVTPDWELGLLASSRARVGYSNKRGLGISPLVILGFQAQSQVVHIAAMLRKKLTRRFADRKVVLVIPASISESVDGPQLVELAKKSGVMPLTPTSAREALAVLAQSGLTLAVAPQAWQLERLRQLRRLYGMNIRFWPAYLPYRVSGMESESLFDLDDVLCEYWRAATDPNEAPRWSLAGAVSETEFTHRVGELLAGDCTFGVHQ